MGTPHGARYGIPVWPYGNPIWESHMGTPYGIPYGIFILLDFRSLLHPMACGPAAEYGSPGDILVQQICNMLFWGEQKPTHGGAGIGHEDSKIQKSMLGERKHPARALAPDTKARKVKKQHVFVWQELGLGGSI